MTGQGARWTPGPVISSNRAIIRDRTGPGPLRAGACRGLPLGSPGGWGRWTPRADQPRLTLLMSEILRIGSITEITMNPTTSAMPTIRSGSRRLVTFWIWISISSS